MALITPITHFRPRSALTLLPLLALMLCCITIAGCSTCEKETYPPDTYDHPHPSANLIYDRYLARSQPGYVDPQTFVRPEWPLAERPYGYVTSGETIYYREYRYSDQAVYGNNEARTHMHNRLRSYRYGKIYR